MDTENLNPLISKPPLRLLDQWYLPLIVAWGNNTALSHVLGIKTPVTPEDANAWLTDVCNGKDRLDFAFEKDGEVRALGGLREGRTNEIDGHMDAEIYTFVYPSLMNLGIGADVVESLCFVGFKELGLDSIHIIIDSDDRATRYTYKKCGFHTSIPYIEESCGNLYYSLSRSDWDKNSLFKQGPR